MNWEQFRVILWLRWRLTRNQLARRGQINAALSIFLVALMLLASVGFGVGGVALGAFAAAKAPAQALLLIWDGVIFFFLIFWAGGLMVEIQRSESIDLTKLLHLPVTLQQVFVFNYLASHFTPSIVVLLPGMLGLAAGLVLGAGPAMALMFPLVLGFIFMVTAWTYCLRGWLAALMVNKRRRRAIIVWMTIGIVLLGQLPNLVVNSPLFRQRFLHRPQSRQQSAGTKSATPRDSIGLPDLLVVAHSVAPPGWVGYGALQLKEGAVWPALALAAEGFLIGTLGLMQAYRMTLRFYQGAEKRTAAAPVGQLEKKPNGPLLVERRLPWLPDDTAALALATFRSLTRAPELKMALIAPVILGIVLSSMWFTRSQHPPVEALHAFLATAAVMFASFALAPTMANVFGLDRNGFRALVLLPTRRHHVLFAKNLAFFPFVGGTSLVLILLAKVLVQMSWLTVLVGLLQLPTAFLLFSLLHNMLSILAPYRLAQGTLKAKQPRAIVFVATFGALLLTPVVLFPLLIPPVLQLLFLKLGWLPWLPVNLLTAAMILAAAAGLYRAVLPLQGRLLQRREQTILSEVTEEVE